MLSIKDLVFPKTCPICDRTHKQLLTARDSDMPGICEDCEKKLIRIQSPFCAHCGKPFEAEEDSRELCADCEKTKGSWSFVQGRGLFLYTGEITQAMYRLKYSSKREYARSFAYEAYEQLGDWVTHNGIEAIIPIPLHKDREIERGYNQALDFAKELSKLLKVPCESDILIRVKKTIPQKQLDDKNRLDNLKNAFHIEQKAVKYKKILLVDDIYTTGVTVSTAAECLLQYGVEAVYVMCIAIGAGD